MDMLDGSLNDLMDHNVRITTGVGLSLMGQCLLTFFVPNHYLAPSVLFVEHSPNGLPYVNS